MTAFVASHRATDEAVHFDNVDEFLERGLNTPDYVVWGVIAEADDWLSVTLANGWGIEDCIRAYDNKDDAKYVACAVLGIPIDKVDKVVVFRGGYEQYAHSLSVELGIKPELVMYFDWNHYARDHLKIDSNLASFMFKGTQCLVTNFNDFC